VVILGTWLILFWERFNVFMNRHYFRQNKSMLFIWFASISRFYNFLISLKFISVRFDSHILRSVNYSLLPITFVEFKGLNVIYSFFKEGRFTSWFITRFLLPKNRTFLKWTNLFNEKSSSTEVNLSFYWMFKSTRFGSFMPLSDSILLQ